jgi:hypothetical protein
VSLRFHRVPNNNSWLLGLRMVCGLVRLSTPFLELFVGFILKEQFVMAGKD